MTSPHNVGRFEMTCTLILMRHSYAADGQSCRDFDRELTVAGIRLASDTGRLLSELCVVPDLIVTSAAARTVQTGQCVAEKLESDTVQLITRLDLYQAPPVAYLSAIHLETTFVTSTVLCIGHNPGIEMLISSLAGQRLSVPPATAGIFEIATEDWFKLPSLSNENSQLTHLIVGAQLSSMN